MLTELVVSILVVLHPVILFILVTISFLGCQKATYCLTLQLWIWVSCSCHNCCWTSLGYASFTWPQGSYFTATLTLMWQQKCFFFSSNLVYHKRVKHVELDYHFLRELVIAGKLRTQYVPSHLQVADIFTKSISRPIFEFFRSKLHVCSNPTLSLRGLKIVDRLL